MHFLRQFLQCVDFGQVAVNVNLERGFDRLDIDLHRFRNGFQQGLVRPGDIVQHFAARRFRGQELLQSVSGLDRLCLGPVTFRLRDVVQEVLDQLDRLALQQTALTDDQDHSKQRVDFPQQVLDRHAELELLARNRFDQRADDPPDACNLLGNRAFFERFTDFFQPFEALFDRLFLDDLDQGQLVNRAQFFRQQLRTLVAVVIDSLDFGALLVHRQVGQEQQLLGKKILVSDGADIVQQRQDGDWYVAMPRLYVL